MKVISIQRIIVFCYFVLSFSIDIFAGKELIINPYRQWGSKTCWAACSYMILSAYQISGIGSDEMAIRRWAFPPNGPDTTNYMSGTPNAVDKILQYFGSIYSTFTPFNPNTGGGNISQSDLTWEIDKGRPALSGRLIADGSPTGRKHMLLIRGYTDSGGSDAGNVIYNDPANGQRLVQSYAEFVRRGNEYQWIESLRLTTNPRVPIPTGIGPKELVRIQSGTMEITQSPQSLSYTALKTGDHVPVRWIWKLIFHHSYGECIAASWIVNSSSFQSTWNIPNFVLPSGYQWRYNYDGKIPGKVEVVVEDNAGPPTHEDAINVLYRPSVLYPGTLVFENQVITNSQPDVKAHELIITRNDLFAPGGNISLKSGERIDITDGVTVQNGSTVNFKIDPSLR